MTGIEGSPRDGFACWLGAILLASTLSGCGALILAHQDLVGLDGPASANVALGSSRETVATGAILDPKETVKAEDFERSMRDRGYTIETERPAP